MSLACYECQKTGFFDTLIIFKKDQKFEGEEFICNYKNFYTDCTSIDDFEPVEKSCFAIVKEPTNQGAWFTGNNGAKLKEVKFFPIDEEKLKEKLPRIYGALRGKVNE